jgi:TonB-dependent receptor
MLFNFYRIKKCCLISMAVLSLLLIQSFSYAQTGIIKGTVTDKSSKETLVGANIIVQGTNQGAASDLDGNYIIYNVSAGSHVLVVSYVGYKSTSINVKVEEKKTSQVNIRLEAEAIEGKVVTVTAQAAGQLQAINEQLSSNNIVNVVSAEKMQELPDANIAESIGRLPGISLERNAGEAYAVVVRGLSPQYNEVSIEGVPMSSTNYQDRSIDLSLLSDNMVKGVEVSKTLRPDMDANALGGTVNLTLKTAEPGLKYNFWGNGGYTNLTKSYDNYKFAGSISDRFLNDKIGVQLQGNLEEKQLPSDQFNATYSIPQYSGSSYVSGNPYYINTSSTELSENTVKRERYGFSLILDYKSDWLDIKFFNLVDAKVDSNLTRDYSYNFNSYFYDQIFINQTKTVQETHSLQSLFKFAGTELPVSLSYTKSAQRTPNGQEFDFEETGVGSSFPTIPSKSVIYGQPIDLINIMGTLNPTSTNSSLWDMYNKNTNLTDESYDGKADWKLPFSMSDEFSGTLSAGGKYHESTRHSSQTSFWYDIQYGGSAGRRIILANSFSFLNGINTTWQNGITAVPFVDKSYSTTSILGYPIGPGFNVSYLSDIMNTIYPALAPIFYTDGPSDFDQNYKDQESSVAGYVMGELNVGSNLTIVPGARYQDEMTNISAYQVQLNGSNQNGLAGTPPDLVGSKRNFANWYPSVNIKYKATDNIQVMGAIYQSVSLPSYTDISPMVLYEQNGGTSIVTSNPLLRPSTAWNYDLGASWFNNLIGLFSADFFYKDISNLIYSMQNFFPFTAYPVIAPKEVLDRLPGSTYYNQSWAQSTNSMNISTSIPMNDPDNAYLRGVELSWQTHFWYLPGVLSGLVLDCNVSFMSSNQMYPSFWVKSPKVGNKDTIEYQTVGGPLQNQPKATYNVILGWDYEGFSARISYRDQKTTVTSIDTRFGLEDYYYGDVTLFDISLKQKILNNLSVFANATNIGNHIDSYYYTHPSYTLANSGGAAPTYYPAGNLPTSEQTYGWILQAGISFSY